MSSFNIGPTSIIPVLASLAVALISTKLLQRRLPASVSKGRYVSIDGLRGYLAFFVFMHHSCVWYFFLKTGEWKIPPSNLYTHFGQTSVAFFFMITGFLFYSKLLDQRKINWQEFLLSRFLRLFPVYAVMLVMLFGIVWILSAGQANEPVLTLSRKIISWTGFTILGAPDINHISPTALIVSGVTWSLPYEWLFYFALPLLSITTKNKAPPLVVGVGTTAALAVFLLMDPQPYHLLAFLGGIAGALLVRSHRLASAASSDLASLTCITCIAAAVYFFQTSHHPGALALLSVGFIIIACGNDLFGLLGNSLSRAFGQLAYSMYLFHGISLYVMFTFVFDRTQSSEFSPAVFWSLIFLLTPCLTIACLYTFRIIEAPGMTWSRPLILLFSQARMKKNAEG